MNFITLLSQSLLALKMENEFELAYSHGKNLNNRNPYWLKKPFFSGIFFQILAFFYFVFTNFTFLKKKIPQKKIFAFAGTINQLNSLQSTLKSFQENHDEYYLSLHKNIIQKNLNLNNSEKFKFNFIVAFCGIILFFLRALPLFNKLKNQKNKIHISNYFNVYCKAYVFLPHFFYFLHKMKPKIILIAGDHNVYNRCLRLTAQILGIKTVYYQHSSVSNQFPPLEFDYAFLDGKVAYQIYLKNYLLIKKKNKRIKKNVSNCKIFLTGQKKEVVNFIPKKTNNNFNIGLAISDDDDFNNLTKLLYHMLNFKIKCIIRTHPGQKLKFIKQLNQYISDKKLLYLSNSKEQSIDIFFNNINLLIASDSSIHLEAAQAGLPTFYYEMENNAITDYYGYVKNHISKKLEKNFSLELLLNLSKNMKNDLKREEEIGNYSETYKSKWMNQEGYLCRILINKIIYKQNLNDLFRAKNCQVYNSVHLLKD